MSLYTKYDAALMPTAFRMSKMVSTAATFTLLPEWISGNVNIIKQAKNFFNAALNPAGLSLAGFFV